MTTHRSDAGAAGAVDVQRGRIRPNVIKIGGRALEGPAEDEFARAIAALGAPAVLVHGGGSEVSAWCLKLDIEPRFHDGLRVTDPATLEVATAVLAGLTNKRWVARLQAHGIIGAGLAALDAGITRVVPHPAQAELGAVGAVESVDPALLLALVDGGVMPVLASIGAHQGTLLNINADELAAAVAGALHAPGLVLLSDTPGLMLGDRIVPTLDFDEIDAALAHPDVSGGMRPKLAAARHALHTGAERVWIAAWQGPHTLSALFDGTAQSTELHRSRRLAAEVALESSGPEFRFVPAGETK